MVFLTSGCKAPIDTSKDRVPAWAVGGTLHDTRLPYWAQGTPEDKLATSGEVLYEEMWQGHLQTDEYLVAFRAEAEKLVDIMDIMARLYPKAVQVNRSVPTMTIRSLVRDGVDGEKDELNNLAGPASVERKKLERLRD